MSKYALIVDPFSSGALYADALRKLNIIPIAILSHTPILAIYKDSFKPEEFEKIYIHQGSNQYLFSEISEFLSDRKITMILAGTESGVLLADKLSEYFCPEMSNGVELSSCRRNKFDMSHRLQKMGVPVPLAIKSDSLNDVLDWIRENTLLPSGVVIKPLDSAGTDGVSACFSESDVRAAMKNTIGKINQFNSRNSLLLAQEYVSGTEYVIDTVSMKGKHLVTNICQYKKTQANGSSFVYDSLDFLPEEGLIQQELSDYIYTVLDGLNIQFGPAHSEVMYTPKGPRLIETGSRLHGGIAIAACRLATGSSQLDETLKIFLNKTSFMSNKIGFELKKYTRIVFLISHFENLVVGESENLNSIRNLPSLVTLKLNINEGDFLKKTIDLFSMPGLLVLSSESEQQVEEDYQEIRRLEHEGLFILGVEKNITDTILI